jgi:hypothetical protein
MLEKRRSVDAELGTKLKMRIASFMSELSPAIFQTQRGSIDPS